MQMRTKLKKKTVRHLRTFQSKGIKEETSLKLPIVKMYVRFQSQFTENKYQKS